MRRRLSHHAGGLSLALSLVAFLGQPVAVVTGFVAAVIAADADSRNPWSSLGILLRTLVWTGLAGYVLASAALVLGIIAAGRAPDAFGRRRGRGAGITGIVFSILVLGGVVAGTMLLRTTANPF